MVLELQARFNEQDNIEYGNLLGKEGVKVILGVPGLKVVAPNALGDPGDMLRAAIDDEDPALFIEHKLLYTRSMLKEGKGDLADWKVERGAEVYPAFVLRSAYKPSLTIATYGYNFELVRQAANELILEHEIFTEVILFSQLSPFALDPLIDSLRRTQHLLTVEEGGTTLGWGTEVVAQAAEAGIATLKAGRVAARDLPIANSKTLEDGILPSVADIKQAVLELLE
jgi:pyruvate dehydrogenase E1 component beta subunit